VVLEGDGVAPDGAADSASSGTAMPTRGLEADPIAAEELFGPEEAAPDDEVSGTTKGGFKSDANNNNNQNNDNNIKKNDNNDKDAYAGQTEYVYTSTSPSGT
jgi:hypothetical protein